MSPTTISSAANEDWKLLAFDQLTTKQLYSILALRAQVFVVEQDCPYQDCDGQDSDALHLCLYQDQELIAYARLFAPTQPQATAKIGRVVVAHEHRSTQLGQRLMQRAVYETDRLWNTPLIQISAQYHLQDFYRKFDFNSHGNIYLEDNIEHIKMLRQPI